MITSRNQLIHYIRSQLGEPIIKVEVTDDQISTIIDSTIQMYTEYAPYAAEDTVIIELNGKGDYKLPDCITHILKCAKGQTGSISTFATNFGSNLVPDIWTQQFFSDNVLGSVIPAVISINNTQSMLRKFFGDDINYSFNPYQKILRVLDDTKGPVLLHYYYTYKPNDEHDHIFDHEWIKKYCVAKTKHLWGSILGKYSANLVGGSQLNYADIKNDAATELADLKEELLNRWTDPAPFTIG